MKIGLFTDGYYPQINGVATTVEELKESLRVLDHSVYIVAPKYPKYKDKDPKVFRLKSFRLYRNPELRLSYMFPDKIFQKVLKVDFDIIHGFSGGSVPSLGLALAKLKKKPYVFTYNTRLNHYTHYFLGGKILRPKAVEKVVELYCNVCDYVVAPAEYVKKELIEFGVKKPIAVIPNGVDIKKFKPFKSDLLRKKMGLSKNDKVILYVGRLAKEKSVDFLIRAFAKLKHDNIYFAIVGDGPERKNLENLVKKLDLGKHIIFLGFVEHNSLADVYNSADVFVFSSTTETQGMIIPEAMASGLPVLTVKDKVFDQFIENGVSGFMVENKETIFAQKLQEILQDKGLRTRISKEARLQALKFSLDEIAKKFENLYKQLA
ncbi:MAG: glycosyltransferase family 4 protein [Candidatus Levybacteria bacterium]|nr:glycosyltransferase family 4 protein [Candidatus Levybacteria bacterium]